MSDATLTMLVHGEAGTGKSWLGATTPSPRLILDAEGRARYLPGDKPKVFWDPYQEAPPVADGSWDTCVAVVPEFQHLDRVYKWLQSGEHPFVSVVVDSLMEAQKRLIDKVGGVEQLDYQGWGEVLRVLEKTVRDYRDLVASPSNVTRCVVLTVGSRANEKTGRIEPLLQGALRNNIPYYLDVVGYLYNSMSTEQPGQISRNLLVAPLGHAVAKDNTDRLISAYGPTVAEPNISTIFTLLNGQPEAPVADAAPQVAAQPQQGGVPQ